MIATFVKKEFPKKDWDNHYSKIGTYKYLSRNPIGDGIIAMFSMPTEDGIVPLGYTSLNEDELRFYDDHCKSNNIYPRPFEDKDVVIETSDKQEGIDKMDIIRDHLKNKFSMKV